MTAGATGAYAAGPTVTTVLSGDAILRSPYNLATDGTNLFVTGTNANASDPNRNPSSFQCIFQVPLAGGAAKSLYPAFNPQQLAIIGATVFWIDPNSGSVTDTQILSAPKAGGGSVTAIYNQPGNQVIFDGSGLTTDGTALYASDYSGGGIHKLNTDGSGLLSIVGSRFSSGEQFNGLACAQTTLYIADSGNNGGTARLQSVSTSGSGLATTVSGSPFVHPYGIAIGGGMIYVSDPGAGNTIWQIPQSGGAPTALVAGSPFNNLGGLVYFNGALYVADIGGSAIYKVVPGASAVAPTITTQPASLSVNLGSGATFTVTASGTATLTYQWYLNSAAINGATSSIYSISSAQTSNAGSYTVKVTNTAGSVTSNAATLTVVSAVAPTIATQPANLSVHAGSAAVFTVSAGGTAVLTYQWYLNGTAIGGATTASYSISSSQAANAGSYTVKVTNSAGSVTSNAATLTVISPPTITTQPAGQSVNAGDSVTFTVAAGGTAPLTYQWYLNGTAIGGAISSSYTLVYAQSSNAGGYTVAVTNSAGSVTSNAATLTVNTGGATGAATYTYDPAGRLIQAVDAAGNIVAYTYDSAGNRLSVSAVSAPPVIISQPVGQTLNAGSTAVFTAVLSGASSYQWQFNGVNLADGTNGGVTIAGSSGPQLMVTNATAANAGNYTLVAINAVGAVSSSNVTLAVAAVSNPGLASSISTRAFVGTGDNILIGGFYIVGATSRSVLVQGLGPALAPLGVTGALQHPTLSIHQTRNGSDVTLYSNTGWGSSQVLLNAAAGVYASPVLSANSADSELLLTLPPGGYSAEVSGADGGTGVALCAIYELP
jgi:YD repeat-containing protein